MKTVREYPHITVTQGLSGHFAVMIWLNTEDISGQSFPEPWSSGVGRYKMQADAIREAIAWAEAEEIPYYGPELKEANKKPARQDVEKQLKEIIPNIRTIHLG